MRIGEIGERAGLSTKALRYYERVGLIEEPTRTASGYRDYDQSVLDRLRFIRSARAAGRAVTSSSSSRAAPPTWTAVSPSWAACATTCGPWPTVPGRCHRRPAR